MFSKIIFCSIFTLAICACKQSNKIQKTPEIVKAYIKRPELDSVSKQDLQMNNQIHFSKSNLKITMAVAYFDQGTFKNVRQQTFAGNKLGFLNSLTWVSNAKTPFRITIADIHYIDKKGNKGIAEEFSFIVY